MQYLASQRHRLRAGVYLVAAVGCSIAWFESALPQHAGSVTIDARRCIEIESPDERLACFESQVDDALRENSDSARTAQPSTPRVEAARVPRQDTPDQTEWVGSIASLQQRAPNRYVITLDSGQVWEQRVAARYPMRVGQRVRIYSSRWGNSQRLEADGLNGFIQVSRVN